MGAYENVKGSITGIPAADLRTKRYTFVKYDANGNVVTTGAGERAIGTAREPGNINQPIQVQNEGHAFIYIGAATLATGAEVMPDANGNAIAYVPGTATNRPAGVMAVGGAAGALGTVLLQLG